MKPFKFHAAMFCGSTSLVLVGLNVLMGVAFTGPEFHKHQRVFQEAVHLPHLILGNSKVVHGVNPRYLERPDFPVYNMGFNGASPVYFLRWYQAFRSRHPAPKTVLYEVNWFLYKPVMWRRLEHDSEFLPFETLTQLAQVPEASLSVMSANRFPLIKHRDDVLHALLPERNRREMDMRGYYKGFVPLTGKTDQDSGAYRVPDSPAIASAFMQLLKRFRADGVRMIFFQAPEYLPVAGEHPTENRRLASLASQYGVPFLNYNTDRRSSMNLERGNFCDWSHLNETGSMLFSERLGRDLKQLGIPTASEERHAL